MLVLIQGLPRFELGLLDSESKVIANYTTGPLDIYFPSQFVCANGESNPDHIVGNDIF